MPKLLLNRRVFIVAVLCGVVISASYYIAPPLDSNQVSGGAWNPFKLLSLLTIVPRIFTARILWEALGLPTWLGEALFFLYWPLLGAVVGVCKHWRLWAVVILVINVGLLAFVLYELSRIRITF